MDQSDSLYLQILTVSAYSNAVICFANGGEPEALKETAAPIVAAAVCARSSISAAVIRADYAALTAVAAYTAFCNATAPAAAARYPEPGAANGSATQVQLEAYQKR